MGDVFLWLGTLQAEDYTCPTPDGRPVTRSHSGERLARAVCADGEMLDEQDIDQIAEALSRAQRQRITEALQDISRRHPQIDTAVVTGLGAFIGMEAAHAAGLAASLLGDRAEVPLQTAPATAAAWLLHESLTAAR